LEKLSLQSYIEMLYDNANEHGIKRLDHEVPVLRLGHYIHAVYGDLIADALVSMVSKNSELQSIDFVKAEIDEVISFFRHKNAIDRMKYTINILDEYNEAIERVSDIWQDPRVIDLSAPLKDDEYHKDILFKKKNHNRYRFMFGEVDSFFEMETIQRIINKTWNFSLSFEKWTNEEFELLDAYYSENIFGLVCENDDSLLLDPTSLELTKRRDDSFMAGISAIGAIHRAIMIDLISDFVDELLLFNKHHSVKGSAQCVECGQMYPRSPYGHSQKYCTLQCKERAKKRRQRERTTKKSFINRRSK